MTIEAKIICDSVSPAGKRITTFQLKYPRFIHGEVMTHRMFSRNASSSRAIPVKTMIKRIKQDPAMPIHWGKNQKGMQAYKEISNIKANMARSIWIGCLYAVLPFVKLLLSLKVHKQISNRILEPWMHIHVVLTATEFSNFFALRYHHAAQPEICELAKQMWEEYCYSVPKDVEDGEWHLPYVTLKEMLEADDTEDALGDLLMMSTARCARVSYMRHDGRAPSLLDDQLLYDRLLSEQPIHASPAEHQARASDDPEERSGNFVGWIQHRKFLEGENITEFESPLP